MRCRMPSIVVSMLVVFSVCGSLRAYEPGSKYTTMAIQGWKVLVSKAIPAAYKAAKASGRYSAEIYAMSDFKEYFACLTVRHFDNKDRRKVAGDRAPAGLKLMRNSELTTERCMDSRCLT